MDDPFIKAFQIVVGHEGGYSDESSDPGNWTSGTIGVGQRRGTKFGISAAAYPSTDIASLTIDAAQTIYRRDYWVRILGPTLPPRLALLAFDAAVNNGVDRAARWLQASVGTEIDGDLGPQTVAAIAQRTATADEITNVCIEFQAQRVNFMATLPTWRSFGLGWARRLCALPYQSLSLGVS
jgi:lysozyme family protein